MISLPWLAEHIGLALLHSVWEGSALAILLAVVMWVLRSRSAQIRYVLGCSTLLLMVAAPIATTVYRPPPQPPQLQSAEAPPTQIAPMLTTPVSFSGDASSAKPLTSVRFSLLQITASVWLAGFVVVSLWQISGWIAVRNLVRRSQSAEDSLVRHLNFLRDRVGIQFKIAIRVCGEISTPAVVGWLRPVILVPVTALTELPADYFESLLLHELAHIRRHDYLVNLLQTAVETLLFYHPAAWWVSRAVRQEREYCCDDETVRAADRRTYVQALAMMEALRTDGSQPLAMASGGGNLLRRINRLTASRARRQSGFGPVVICALILATVIISVCYAARADEQTLPPKPATTQPTTQSEVRLRLYDGRYVIATGVREEPVQETRPRDSVAPGDLIRLELYITGGKSGGARFTHAASYVSNAGDLPLELLDKSIHVQGIKTADLQGVIEKAYEDAGFDSHTVQGVNVSSLAPGQSASFMAIEVIRGKSSIRLLDAINARGGIEGLGVRQIYIGGWSRPPVGQMSPSGRRLTISFQKLVAGDPEANVLLDRDDQVMLSPSETPVVFEMPRLTAPAPVTRSSGATAPAESRGRSK